MNYDGKTIRNKSFIKRFSHSKRYLLSSELIAKFKPLKILDYGAGDGELYKFVNKSQKKNYYFYEPNISMVKELKFNLKKYKINKIFSNPQKIYQNYFDLICINEVFEHLNINEQKKIFKYLKKISVKNCNFVISVPIEVGLSSLLKNLIRIFTFQTHENTTFKNILKSFFYVNIKKSTKKYSNSHIGFNYINFINFLKKENLKILNVYYSPFNSLRGLINSQIFIVAKF